MGIFDCLVIRKLAKDLHFAESVIDIESRAQKPCRSVIQNFLRNRKSKQLKNAFSS